MAKHVKESRILPANIIKILVNIIIAIISENETSRVSIVIAGYS